jgi:Flp pilus assembly protein TadD
MQRLEVWRDPVWLWTDNAAKSPDKARVHGNLGKACLSAGDAACAERAFARAVALDPRLDAARNGLASVLLDHHRDYEGASRVISEALARSPDFVPALVNLGVLQLRTGRAEAAAATLERAARLEPNDRAVLSNLATVLVSLRRYDQAAVVLDHGLRVWPFDGRLHALSSLASLERGDLAQSRRSARLALAANPNDEVAQAVRSRLDAQP